MAEFAIQGNMRALDGSLLLALEDEANGYWIRGEGLLAVQQPRIRRVSRSPWADGTSQDGSTLDEFEGSVLVKVFGPTWAVVERRFHALLAVTRGLESWVWEDVVEGVSTSWRAGAVEVQASPTSAMDIANRRRFVVLSFPVQPTPTVTGI